MINKKKNEKAINHIYSQCMIHYVMEYNRKWLIVLIKYLQLKNWWRKSKLVAFSYSVLRMWISVIKHSTKKVHSKYIKFILQHYCINLMLIMISKKIYHKYTSLSLNSSLWCCQNRLIKYIKTLFKEFKKAEIVTANISKQQQIIQMCWHSNWKLFKFAKTKIHT